MTDVKTLQTQITERFSDWIEAADVKLSELTVDVSLSIFLISVVHCVMKLILISNYYWMSVA